MLFRSGCAVVLPTEGGVGEYAIGGVNARLVDTTSEEQCHAVLREIVMDREVRCGLQAAALCRAAEFSVRRAVVTEVDALGKQWRERRHRGRIRRPVFLNGRSKKVQRTVRS